MARKTRGRQKLAMVRIENESNRLVTFSKRRTGVFKKASELATLCGIDVAIIVFSPGQRVFSFGHPSVEHIVHKFYSGRQPANQAPQLSATAQFIENQRNTRLQEVGFQLSQVLELLEMGRKRAVELDRKTRASRNKTLAETPIEKLNGTQLLQLKASLELLKARVDNQAHVRTDAHVAAQAQYVQAQVQAHAEHQRQLQMQQQLYLNAAEPHLQLAVDNNHNNNMANNGGGRAASAGHLEFYQRLMDAGNFNLGGGGGGGGDGGVHIGGDGGNGNVVGNGGAFQEYRGV